MTTEKRASVSALILMATWGARPIGAGLAAVIGGVYGAETCLAVATIGFAIQAAVILTSPVPRLVRQPGLA